MSFDTASETIEFRDVSVTMQERIVLRGISLAMDAGTVVAVLGRSGSGKTTLLRTVNRMVEANSGDVLVAGKSVRDADLVRFRRCIGYVIQETGLFPHFTVERNVGIVLEAEGKSYDERRARAFELLRAVGLDPEVYAKRYPHQLSGGQQQRVGLARALANDPSILLMDEPFGALDPLTRAEMQDMLRELLRKFRKTVLLVTHDLNEALYLADRIVLLDQGKIAADLPPSSFLHSEQSEVVAYRSAFRGAAAAKGDL